MLFRSASLRERGLSVETYLVGRKAISYYKFRNREIAGSWSGFSDSPTYEKAKEVSEALISSFVDENGADELHIIYTEFKSMLTQLPVAAQVLPLKSEDKPSGLLPAYEFEPTAEVVLNSLLPRYVEARVFNALLQSAASEHAARRRAMKSATDNADEIGRAHV